MLAHLRDKLSLRQKKEDEAEEEEVEESQQQGGALPTLPMQSTTVTATATGSATGPSEAHDPLADTDAGADAEEADADADAHQSALSPSSSPPRPPAPPSSSNLMLPANTSSSGRTINRPLLLLGAWAMLAMSIALALTLTIWQNNVKAEAQHKATLLHSTLPAHVMLGPPPAQDVPILGTHCCTTEYGLDAPTMTASAPSPPLSVSSSSSQKKKGKKSKNDDKSQQQNPASTLEGQLFREQVAKADGNDSVNSGKPQVDGGVYLVATKERSQGDLEAVLSRLDKHFTRLHRYPVIVFLAGAYNLTQEDQDRLRAAAPTTVLDFQPLPTLQQLAVSTLSTENNSAGAAAASYPYRYDRSLWEFQVAEAPRLLFQKYEWVLQLSEDTLLSQDVLLDPFHALVATERKLGYAVVRRVLHEEALWAFGRNFALQHGVNKEQSSLHLTWDVAKAMDPRWIALHRSVFTAELYQALIVSLASSSLTQVQQQQQQQQQQQTTPAPTSPAKDYTSALDALLAFTSPDSIPPATQIKHLRKALDDPPTPSPTPAPTQAFSIPCASAVMTLASLMVLPKQHFMQYRGLTFQRPPQKLGVEGLTPEEAAGTTRSTWRDIHITATEAEDLQPLFAVRTEGWLGADVATSFRFPPRVLDGEEVDAKYMWLFGDTLLGYASQDRRLAGAFFLHNSVAFVPAYNASTSPPPGPEEVTFAWNVSRGGCPVSVFVRVQQDDECVHTQEYLWPISGLGVSYPPEKEGDEAVSKVVVLAVRWAYIKSMAATVDLFNDDAFNFKILGTTAIVVDNPHEDPASWQYRQKDLPGTDENLNWYSAMMHGTQGQELATHPDELIYLFGINNTEAVGTPPQQWQYETLARVPIKSLVDLTFDDMEVWAMARKKKHPRPETDNTTWASYDRFLQRGMKAAPLVFPVFSETSVRYSETLGAYYGVVVDWLASQIVLYVSEDLTGKWEPVVVYKIPPPFDDPAVYMTYAGKTHPELARDNEIILTFMTNAPGDLEPLFEAGAKDVYVPRFVRLTLDRVVAPQQAAGTSIPAP